MTNPAIEAALAAFNKRGSNGEPAYMVYTEQDRMARAIEARDNCLSKNDQNEEQKDLSLKTGSHDFKG